MRPRSIPAAKSELEERFRITWEAIGGCPLEREVVFHPTRQWRLDFAEPTARIAFEIDGGTANGKGRHSRGEGYRKDCEKINAAQVEGWTVLRLTGEMIQPAYLEELAEAFGLWSEEKRRQIASEFVAGLSEVNK